MGVAAQQIVQHLVTLAPAANQAIADFVFNRPALRPKRKPFTWSRSRQIILLPVIKRHRYGDTGATVTVTGLDQSASAPMTT
jgi:hypothetical protein